MGATKHEATPNWGWGTPWQLWACRLSHALGLVVVLGMLVVLGATSSGQDGPATATAAEISASAPQRVTEVRSGDALQAVTPARALTGIRSLPPGPVLSAIKEQRAALAARLEALLTR